MKKKENEEEWITEENAEKKMRLRNGVKEGKTWKWKKRSMKPRKPKTEQANK